MTKLKKRKPLLSDIYILLTLIV